MRISTTLLGTHVLAAGMTALLVIAAQSSGTMLTWSAAGIALLLSTGLALIVSSRISSSITRITNSVADIEAPQASVGFQEVDQVVAGLRELAHRWSDASVRARHDFRELRELMDLFDRREDTPRSDEASVNRLRKLISSLLQATREDLHQVSSHLGDIERFSQQMSQGTDSQTEAVNKSVTYVEQICLRFDSVTGAADSVKQATTTATESTRQAKGLVRELVRGMEALRLRLDRSERKLRALSERSQQIGSIVASIGAISSRTDLLALNASIESIRAGEQGRGFSVVAEEVRKLAEQTAKAAHEVSALAEKIQTDAQESISGINEQGQQLTVETQRVRDADNELTRLEQAHESSVSGVREISQMSQQQLQLSQDLVLVMENLSETTRQNRGHAEQTGFICRTVAKLSEKVNGRIDPVITNSHPAPAKDSPRSSHGDRADGRRSERGRDKADASPSARPRELVAAGE